MIIFVKAVIQSDIALVNPLIFYIRLISHLEEEVFILIYFKAKVLINLISIIVYVMTDRHEEDYT